MRRKFTWKPYSISKEGYNAYELYVNKKYFGVLYESKIPEKSSIFEIDNQSGGSSSPGSYDRPIIIFFKTVKVKYNFKA